MPLLQDGQHIHHHGILAGVSAGAMTVLAVTAIILVACRKQLGEVATVAAIALIVLIVGAVAYLFVYGFLRLRLHARSPETLIRRPQVTAGVVQDAVSAAAPPAELPAPQPAAELPAAGNHTHYHFDSPEAVGAALQAMRERQITEGN